MMKKIGEFVGTMIMAVVEAIGFAAIVCIVGFVLYEKGITHTPEWIEKMATDYIVESMMPEIKDDLRSQGLSMLYEDLSNLNNPVMVTTDEEHILIQIGDKSVMTTVDQISNSTRK